jgi:hypothetical protein
MSTLLMDVWVIVLVGLIGTTATMCVMLCPAACRVRPARRAR